MNSRRTLWIIASIYGMLAAALFGISGYRLSVGDRRAAAALAAGALYAVFRATMVSRRAKQLPPG